MNPEPQSPDEARDEVSRRVRRTVGLKVLRDVSQWAQGVEREHGEKPRIVVSLLALVLALAAVAGLVVWGYYRGF